jgi:hypothetical protein
LYPVPLEVNVIGKPESSPITVPTSHPPKT